MSLLGRVRRRVADGEQIEKELDAELRFDYDQRVARHVGAGLSEAEARRAARLEFGGIEQIKEECRDARGLEFIHSLVRDVRYALRMFKQYPGFAAVAIGTLAVGIGVNATVFTVTNATLFKGFPLVRDNDRIVYMTSSPGCCVSYPDFLDWRARAKSFEGMAIVHGVAKTVLYGSGFPESHDATEVSADTFKLAGQRPFLGRDFTTSDEIPGAAPVVMLRYNFWERRFAGDPHIVNRTIRLNGIPTTVIGVMPRGFSFPQNQDLWIPLAPTPQVMNRENRDTWFVFGRMAPGITIEKVRVEMATIGRRLENAWPATDKGSPPIVYKFDEFFIGPNATLVYQAMWAAVAFVLLIACANLANVLLARAMGRAREISVRVALGAGRWRIVRQLLIESVILSGFGGFFGWWIAKWSVHVYALAASGAIISDATPGVWFDHVLDYSMDQHVFAYLLAISIGTGLLFGLAPALRLSKLDVNAALKDGGRGATAGGRGKHLSALLVIAEMALAVVLLAGAGVMLRSFLKIYAVDVGFNTNRILTTLISLPKTRYPGADAQVSFFDRLETRLRAVPGVESVALTSELPGWTPAFLPFELAGAPPVEVHPRVMRLIVSPEWFQTLGMPLISGRQFSESDGPSAEQVAIVNQRFTSQYWAVANPLGKRFRLLRGKAPGPWLTVVGVAQNIAQSAASPEAFESAVYVPWRQNPTTGMWVAARAGVPPDSLSNVFRREVRLLDPELPLGVDPAAGRLAPALQYKGFSAVLFLIFAAIALLLASVGLYAVVANSVSRRAQEIGVRMALGATAREILKLVFRNGMFPVAIGLAIGLAGSFAVNRLLKAQLTQVSPADPAALLAASATLILAAVLGCLIPARRATRVDPVVALRHE
ncbi:MAG TPA: ABC transporter permease [Bryobacteraceae bacterium]|nr:ABC transporter permease [Bryobacteraceae bacterium]